MSEHYGSTRSTRQRLTQAHSPELGARLRTERQHQQIGLRELAKRVGISPSLLSQIETGKSKPSVGTLYAVADALNISLDNLFLDGRVNQQERAPEELPIRGPGGDLVQRATTRHAISLESGVRWELLTSTPDAMVEFLSITYDVGGTSATNDALMRHPGREYGVVLTGQLGVTIGFETHELGPGDSISFDSTRPHRLWNLGEEPVHAIWFVVHH